MPGAYRPPSLTVAGRVSRLALSLLTLGLGLGAICLAGAAIAAVPPTPTEAHFAISLIAVAPRDTSNCKNIASLDGHLFLACENAASSSGGGTSTIAEYTEAGALIHAWSIAGEAAGIGADALNHRLIVTLDKDANSRLLTITPSAPPDQQVTKYKYAPGAPDSAATSGASHTGGGTDSVSVDSSGEAYVTASHASARHGTAVFAVKLSPPHEPGGVGSATLTPTFLDGAKATNANTGSEQTLSLDDVGADAIVPYVSPADAGNLVVDDKRARTLVFASDINAGTGLTTLKTPLSLDAIRWSTAANGALYILDTAGAGASAIYELTGPFVPGVAFASIGHEVVTVNLSTGALTPFVRNLTLASGLIYLDPSGAEASLPLAPLAAATPLGPAVSGSTGNENYTAVLLVLVFVLLFFGGSYELLRRRRRAS